MGAFKEAHGGELKQLYLGEAAAEAEKKVAQNYKSWDLSERQLCDLELILNGAFSPLEGFLGKDDYESVLRDMRLKSGLIWSIPINLDVSKAFGETIKVGESIALRDQEGVLIATLKIQDIWTPDKAKEAWAVYGTEDQKHPGVDYIMNTAGPLYVGGTVRGVESPTHYDFKLWRDSPAELRGRFRKMGWSRIVAFQTRNPMHRAHLELTFRAAQIAEANLLIQPVVGLTKPGDIDHYTRVRCYEKLLRHYPEQTTTLALLHLAMRMGGPREALWHAIIRKNHGCTHFIVGRDHAGPGKDSSGTPFYGPYDAQTLVARHQAELGITMVPFQEMVFVAGTCPVHAGG
jgi:sulfate adenylyltransferase